MAALEDMLAKQLPSLYEGLNEIVSLERLGKGQANANYMLEASSGRYFMKVIPPSQYNRLPRQVSFYANIGRSKLKTVQPLLNRIGSVVSEVSHEKVLLFPFEPITEPAINAVTADSIGQLVAQLHVATVEERQLEDAWYGPKRCLAQLRALDKSAQQKYQRYVPYIESIGPLPKGFVFDDVCTDNIYAKDGELLGFIDPENAGYGEFVFDIAGAMLMCFFPLPEKFELSRLFLRGYEANRVLAEVERDNLFASLLLICVQLSMFFESQPEPRSLDRIKQRTDFADSLLAVGKAEFDKRIFVR